MNNSSIECTKILSIYQDMDLAVIAKDSEGKVIYLNDNIKKIFKLSQSEDEFIGKDFDEVLKYMKLFVRDEISFENEILKLFKSKKTNKEFFIELKDGKTVKQSYIPIIEEETMLNEFIVFEDVSEKVYLQEKLLELTIYDNLTRVYNRKKLAEEMNKYMELSKRYDNKLAVVIFDVDNFKEINNKFGQEKGDNVLIKIADIVNKRKRTVDIFGRLGGGEFALILPETNINGAKTFAEYLKDKISDVILDETDNKITASFGLTIYNEGENENIDQILKRAYTALEKAKEQGKNKVSVFELIGV